MSIKSFATVALAAIIGAPLSAQVVARNDSSVAERVEAARRRIESRRERARMDSVLRSGGASSRVGSRGSSKVPPGHLPPRGMCRVWIDGVPPGRQPPVTDCATAEANRTVNSRVIYGDRESFPGNGKGKFKNRDVAQASRSCSIWDEVVVGGQSVPVCRDRRTSGRFEGDDDDDRFEDDHDDDRGRAKLAKAQGKAGKAAKKGKGGRGK